MAKNNDESKRIEQKTEGGMKREVSMIFNLILREFTTEKNEQIQRVVFSMNYDWWRKKQQQQQSIWSQHRVQLESEIKNVDRKRNAQSDADGVFNYMIDGIRFVTPTINLLHSVMWSVTATALARLCE